MSYNFILKLKEKHRKEELRVDGRKPREWMFRRCDVHLSVSECRASVNAIINVQVP
jgi:hypothetical protein